MGGGQCRTTILSFGFAAGMQTAPHLLQHVTKEKGRGNRLLECQLCHEPALRLAPPEPPLSSQRGLVRYAWRG